MNDSSAKRWVISMKHIIIYIHSTILFLKTRRNYALIFFLRLKCHQVVF